MALTEERPLALPSGAGADDDFQPLGVFRRPATTTGWRSWVTTVDHKKIGIMYGVTAFFFFLVGGSEALLIRAQLARPGSDLLSAETYNQVFTMHGMTMVFLVVMPMAAAFANYLLPAADRGPGRRLPPDERLQPVVLPGRRDLPQHQLVPRRRRRRRLVRLRPQHRRHLLARPTASTSSPSA